MTGRRSSLFAVVCSVLLIGSLFAIGGATVGATTHGSGTAFAVSQGEACYTIEPLGDGSESVEEFYDYRSHTSHPDTDDRQYSSHGTVELQETQVSQFFVHEGSEGTSLVVIHDKLGDEAGGGHVTLNVTGLPLDGEWVVEDDMYGDPDDPPETLHDNWTHEGEWSRIDWFWAENRTDGGAFLGLHDDEFDSITIEPGFNEAADHDHPEDVDSDVEQWVVRSDEETTHDLDMTSPVTISEGACPQPGEFEVTIDDATDPVEAGETITVETTVENVGDETATETITLAADGEQVDERDVELDGGATTAIDLTYQTDDSDVGELDLTVSGDTDSDSTTVTVTEPPEPDPAHFAVTITGTNDPVEEGEPLEVIAEIENTGESEGTQDIEFRFDEHLEATEPNVTLDANATTELTFTHDTSGVDAGEYDVDVLSDDDAASTPVTIDAATDPAHFDVEIVDASDPVDAGDSIEVTAEIENTGGKTGTQDVTLAIDGDQVDETTLELVDNESESVILTWQTEPTDAGDYEATVSSEDDADTTTVTVEETPDPASFDVTIDETSSPVVEGETLVVDATVENVGDETAEQTVSLEIDGGQVDETTLELAGNEAQSVTFTWETAESDAGDYEAAVSSDDDVDTAAVTVQAPPEPAFFDVTIDETNSPVAEGGTLVVNATVENVGDEADEQTVTLDIDGEQTDAVDLQLDGSESDVVSLTWGTETNDAGEYVATVSSDNASDTRDVTVTDPQEPAFFDVTITETNDPIEEGATLEITAEIENTGGQADDQEVTLTFENEPVDTETVSLGGAETATITFAYETESGDVGESRAVEILSDDDVDSTTVTVNEPPEPEPAFFDVTIDETNSPVVEGETLVVDVLVENTGERADQQEIGLDVGELGADAESVDLSGGEATTLSFEIATDANDAGDYTATVASEDDADDTEVTVEVTESAEEAYLSVDIVETNLPIVAGDLLETTATVKNLGGQQTSQTVYLKLDGQIVDTRTVTLGADEKTTIDLSYDTTKDDVGERELLAVSNDEWTADDWEATTIVIAEPQSNTPTETPTPTPTETPTPTPTQTPTPTPTEKPPETQTPAPTQTPSETPTPTPTETPTPTPTETPTPTPTETSADTTAETPTPASTDSPTETPTESPTEMPSKTSTDALTDTPADPSTDAPAEALSGFGLLVALLALVTASLLAVRRRSGHD